MFRKFWLLFILLALMLMLMNGILHAQTGRGVIVIPITSSPEALLDLQPLRCNEPQCDLLNAMLLPTLRAVDINTGRFVSANDDNNGLTESIDLVDDNTAIFTLRDDLTWRDGTPITAYDVYFSYLVIEPAYLRGAVPLDDQRIAFLYEQADCAALDQTQFPVVPLDSTLDSDFLMDFFDEQDNLQEQSDAWFERDDYFRPSARYRQIINSRRTAGVYIIDEVRPLESLRLVSVDGEQAVIFQTMPANRGRVQAFVEGDFTYLDRVPFNERINLLNNDSIQTYQYPTSEGYYLRFNFADPQEPQSAFNEFGEALAQGIIPISADDAVRQAIRVGLDIDALIDRALNGYGTAINGTQSPYSWAHHPDLPTAVYDPARAMRILEDAGWRDTNRDSVRECITCALAETNRYLSLSLLIPSDEIGSIVGAEIARQLQLIGISVNTFQVSAAELSRTASLQDFDAYLTTANWQFPATPDRSRAFTRAEDIIGSGANDISYVDPELESLMTQARTLEGCDIDARAELYREIETIIAEDLPEIWLFAPTNMIAVQDEVLNFTPINTNPLWNMDSWVVINQEVGG